MPRLLAAFALCLLALAPPARVEADAGWAKLKLRKRTLKERRLVLYGAGNALRPGEDVRIGDLVLRAEASRDGYAVRPVGAGPSKPVALRRGKPGRTVTLGSGPSARSVHLFLDDVGRPYVLNPVVWVGKLAGVELVFFDADFDGRYLEAGEDWYGLADGTYAFPCEQALLFHRYRAVVEWVDAAKGAARAQVELLGPGLPETEQRVLEMFNRLRMKYGLYPLEVDEERCRGCRLHSGYMKAVERLMHAEDPAHAAYTEDGAIAGYASMVYHGRNPEQALFGIVDSPRHGYEIMAPQYSWTAVGYDEGWITLWKDQESDRRWRDRGGRLPFVFPPNLAADVPVSWHDEIPDPREGDPSERWGYPIRVYLTYDGALAPKYPRDVEVTLVEHDGGAAVPVQVVYDEATQHGDKGYEVKFVVLPRVVLKPRTTYRLRGRWDFRGEPQAIDLTFTTGKQPGQYRDKLR